MNVVVEDIGTCQKKIGVEWPAERVQEEYGAVLAGFCKSAKIKGFRPGKVPVKVVEKRFAKEIMDAVRERLLPAGYQKAIKDNHLNVVQVLDFGDVTLELGKPMSFSVSVEIAPEFELPEYKGIPLQRQKEPVSEDKVDETILSIRERFASFDEVEGRPVQNGDLVQVDNDFLKRIGVDDEATLRTRIREDLERGAEQRETGRLRNATIQYLLNAVEMDVPPTVVSRETQAIVQDIVRENTLRGANQEQLREKKEEILDVAAKNATERVKAQFILDRIAEKEQIEVSPQRFREHLDRLATSYGMKPDAFRSELKKREAIDNVKDDLRRSMTVDFLLETAAINE